MLPDHPRFARRTSPASPLHQHSADQGFALIISISLMAFVILLLVTLSVLIQTEIRSTQQSSMVSEARKNAVYGAQVAMAQLQALAGQDRRVTAPATIAYPEKTSPGKGPLWDIFRSHATGLPDHTGGTAWRTFLTETGRDSWESELDAFWESRNPHWIGVWESETRTDENDFDRDQVPRWLVSGNEYAHSPVDQVMPSEELPDPADDPSVAYLVGTGSSVDLAESQSSPRLDGLDGRVKAPTVPLRKPGDSATTGHYAYWVGDQNLKANFTLIDPFWGAAPGSREHRNRLQVPQRSGWERVGKFEDVFASYPADKQERMANNEGMERILVTSQIRLLDPDNSAALDEAARGSFHHITGYSNGLFTDTARGGLQKDLTTYLEDGDGLSDLDTIPDPAAYDEDPRLGPHNEGFPVNLDPGEDGVPTWGQVRSWYRNEAVGGGEGTIEPTAETAPILTQVRLFIGFSKTGSNINLHFLPQVVLWNPYDAGLRSATYEISFGFSPNFKNFRAASLVASGPPEAGAYTGDEPNIRKYPNNAVWKFHELSAVSPTSESIDTIDISPENGADGNYTLPSLDFQPFPDETRLLLEFSTEFGAGESLIFTPGTNQTVALGSFSGNPAIQMELENVHDPDFPLSVRIPVVFADDGLDPTQETRVWATGVETGPLLKDGFDIEILVDGEMVQELPNFGEGASQLAGNLAGLRSVYNSVDRPMIWREVPTSGSFSSEIQGDVDTNHTGGAAGPIFMVAESWLEPFYFRGNWAIWGDEPNDGTYRAFANYNAMAPTFMARHPLIDATRGKNRGGNQDGYERFNAIHTRTDRNDRQSGVHDPLTGEWINVGKHKNGRPIEDRRRNEGQPWDGFNDNAMADADYRGSNLISQRFGTDQRLAGVAEMPVRLVKRPESNVVSLGQLQQVNLSEYLWQPAFPIGNSEAAPYVDREAMAGMTSRPIWWRFSPEGDVIQEWQDDGVQNDEANTLLDVSYILNESLWDRYFLSTVPQSGSFAVDNSEILPNNRIRINARTLEDIGDIRDFDTASAHLFNTGAFNINSTSVEAWKAILAAFRDLQLFPREGDANPLGTVPVSRSLDPLGDSITFTNDASNPINYGATAKPKDLSDMFNGFRYLTDKMIEDLAERIVDEVRLRGPFHSLADFVNRRLDAPDREGGGDAWYATRTGSQRGVISTDYDPLVGLAGLSGTLQRALQVSGINGGVNYPDDPAHDGARDQDEVFHLRPFASQGSDAESSEWRLIRFPSRPYYLDSEHTAGAPVGENGQLLANTPGFVSQADLLSMFGPILRPRGDTFIVRSYGDAVDPLTGEVGAKAWLELIVQRVPEPIRPADPAGSGSDRWEPEDPDSGLATGGRRFEVVNFRWLTEKDI